MYRGTHPATRRLHHTSTKQNEQSSPETKQSLQKNVEEDRTQIRQKALTQVRKRPITRAGPKAKRTRVSIFEDQDGRGGPRLITPVRAAVEQAKALVRRRCKHRRGCKQKGGKRIRKDYNPKRRSRKSSSRRSWRKRRN